MAWAQCFAVTGDLATLYLAKKETEAQRWPGRAGALAGPCRGLGAGGLPVTQAACFTHSNAENDAARLQPPQLTVAAAAPGTEIP